jgi:hypothetical protein
VGFEPALGLNVIYYLATEKHVKPIGVWLQHFGSLWSFRFKVLPYERLSGWVEPGTFIFADYERLTPRLRKKALKTHNGAVKARCTVLNHPRKSLRRYDLQKALNNSFRVFRPREIPEDLRFPVFLREENEHRGNTTPLLQTREQLEAGLARHPDSLTVEYTDTSDRNGFFRKYAAMRIGQRIMPRYIKFSRHWMVKESDIVTDKFVAEEMNYLRSNEHEEQLRAIFDLAKCDYGRIDYSLQEGVIQVWEINSNPLLTPLPKTPKEAPRVPAFQLSAQYINGALRLLDEGGHEHQQRVWCG